jgi:monoamine oxidase
MSTSVDYEKNQTETDVLIVGGGFTGCWFADKLHREHPELKFEIVEASNRLGGRLLSDGNDGDDSAVKDELGGMRMFPDHMEKIKALVERFNLTLVPLNLGDSTNLFQYKGDTVKKADCAELMPKSGVWKNQTPGAMATFAKTSYQSTHFWTDCEKKAYDCPELRNLSMHEFFKKYGNASEEEIACWFAYSGYNLYHRDVQSSIWVDDGELYGSSIDQQHFLKEGYNAVVSNLYFESKATAQINTKVVSLEKDGDYIIAKTEATGARGVTQTIRAKKVILGMTANQITEIENLDCLLSARRSEAIQGCKFIPLFKCFLEFHMDANGQPWWVNEGFPYGKTTSDTDSRQVHYYDEDDLLVYVSDGDSEETKYATRWGDAFASASTPAETKVVLERMWGQVKKMHLGHIKPTTKLPDPDWEKCVYKYWPAGSHKWKKGVDVNQAIDLITDGVSDNSNIFIAGDAFCDMQGWVEGAINTADIAYAKAFEDAK